MLSKIIDRIRRIPTVDAARADIETVANGPRARPERIAFVNAHAVNLGCRDPQFFRNLTEADYLYRDGIGMKIFLLMSREKPGMNMNGSDMIPDLLAAFKGHRVALLGTEEPFLSRAMKAIREQEVEIMLTEHGFHPDHYYLDRLKEDTPPLIVLGMGMPKQERVAALLASSLANPCLIVCGGAVLDFLGGKVRRAPRFMRIAGLEWLFRLSLEPYRLFHRYVVGNVTFLSMAVLYAGLIRVRSLCGRPPPEQVASDLGSGPPP